VVPNKDRLAKRDPVSNAFSGAKAGALLFFSSSGPLLAPFNSGFYSFAASHCRKLLLFFA
jgi:hypothetical protein